MNRISSDFFFDKKGFWNNMLGNSSLKMGFSVYTNEIGAC